MSLWTDPRLLLPVSRYHLHLAVYEADPADVFPDIAAHVGDSFGCVVVVPCHRAGAGQGFTAAAVVFVCSAGFLRVAVALSAVSVSTGRVPFCGSGVPGRLIRRLSEGASRAFAFAEPDRLVVVDIYGGLLVGHGVGHAPDQGVGVLADRVLLHGLASDFCREATSSSGVNTTIMSGIPFLSKITSFLMCLLFRLILRGCLYFARHRGQR